MKKVEKPTDRCLISPFIRPKGSDGSNGFDSLLKDTIDLRKPYNQDRAVIDEIDEDINIEILSGISLNDKNSEINDKNIEDVRSMLSEIKKKPKRVDFRLKTLIVEQKEANLSPEFIYSKKYIEKATHLNKPIEPVEPTPKRTVPENLFGISFLNRTRKSTGYLPTFYY